MQLKHIWNEKQQTILRALKELLVSPPELYISTASMETIQKMIRELEAF